MKELANSLAWAAAQFGECNETGIARWGVATARRLVIETQVWGDGKKAREKHQEAMRGDAMRVAIVIKNPKLARRVMARTLTGLRYGGKKYIFSKYQNLTTEQALNDFIDMNRTSRNARPPKGGLKPGLKAVTTEPVLNKAMRVRYKRIGKAKGGWIGAGQHIGSFQRKGSRITIGKNVAGYAHKHKSTGTASMKRDIWSPEGTMVNSVRHASDPHVLRPGQMEKAISDAAKNTIVWYEKALNGRLNRKK